VLALFEGDWGRANELVDSERGASSEEVRCWVAMWTNGSAYRLR